MSQSVLNNLQHISYAVKGMQNIYENRKKKLRMTNERPSKSVTYKWHKAVKS